MRIFALLVCLMIPSLANSHDSLMRFHYILPDASVRLAGAPSDNLRIEYQFPELENHRGTYFHKPKEIEVILDFNAFNQFDSSAIPANFTFDWLDGGGTLTYVATTCQYIKVLEPVQVYCTFDDRFATVRVSLNIYFNDGSNGKGAGWTLQFHTVYQNF